MTNVYHKSPTVLALEETGLPWEIEPGRGHMKIKLAGHLVGVTRQNKAGNNRRAEKNVIAQIRRKAAELKGQGREQRQ